MGMFAKKSSTAIAQEKKLKRVWKASFTTMVRSTVNRCRHEFPQFRIEWTTNGDHERKTAMNGGCNVG